jgi:hypothetical protein
MLHPDLRVKGFRGFSLVESVIALFLLLTIVMFLFMSFDQALRYQSRAAIRQKAVVIASRTMAGLRAWAQVPANYDSDWSAKNGMTFPDSQDGSYNVRIDCNPSGQPLFSPCFALESQYGPTAKFMTRSLIPVKVTVSWGSGSSSQLAVCSYIGDPPRVPQPLLQITQTGGPQPLPYQQVDTFGVTALDNGQQPIRDLVYTWDIQSITGNAWLLNTGPRNGTTQAVENIYTTPGGVVLDVSGLIQVQAETVYHGLPLNGTTANLTVQ